MGLQDIKLGRSNPYFFHGKLVPIEAGHPMDPTQGWQRGSMAPPERFHQANDELQDKDIRYWKGRD